MTESEWLGCIDPQPILDFLRGKASDRKLRLFAVACCRRVWILRRESRFRKAVEMAEQYADGHVELAELVALFDGDLNRQLVYPSTNDDDYANGSAAGVDAVWTAHASAYCARHIVLYQPTPSRQPSSWPPCRIAHDQEQVAQCNLLRDIFGPLLFRPIPLVPGSINTAVKRLGEMVYETRDFSRLPFLGDALEDAGCCSQEMLDHCRQQGEHVRGCWCLDLILGKE